MSVILGPPDLLPPMTARKRKKKNRTPTKKEKKRKGRVPAVRALCRPVRAQVALPHPATLNWASVVCREVVLRTEGTPGACGQAVGSDVLPPTAPAAESIWPQCLLEGVDLAPASEQLDPTLAEAAFGRLPENHGHHRRGALLFLLEPGPELGPAQPPGLSWDVHPAIFRLKLLSELDQATVPRPPHVAGERDVDSDPLPLLLGDDIRNAAVRQSGCPKDRVPVLEKVLQGGGEGGHAENATSVRAPDPLDSDIADALLV